MLQFLSIECGHFRKRLSFRIHSTIGSTMKPRWLKWIAGFVQSSSKLVTSLASPIGRGIS